MSTKAGELPGPVCHGLCGAHPAPARPAAKRYVSFHNKMKSFKGIRAAAIYLVVVFGLTVSSKYLYSTLTPGVPDAGMVPIALVPWLFYVYEGGISIRTVPAMSVVWISGLVTYLFPPVLSLLFLSRKSEFLFWCGGVLGTLIYSAVQMREFIEYRIFLRGETYNWSTALPKYIIPMAWLVSLTIAGGIVGGAMLVLLTKRKKANQAL